MKAYPIPPETPQLRGEPSNDNGLYNSRAYPLSAKQKAKRAADYDDKRNAYNAEERSRYEKEAQAYRQKLVQNADDLLTQAQSILGIDISTDPEIQKVYTALTTQTKTTDTWKDSPFKGSISPFGTPSINPKYAGYSVDRDMRPSDYAALWQDFVKAVKNYSGDHTKYGY